MTQSAVNLPVNYLDIVIADYNNFNNYQIKSNPRHVKREKMENISNFMAAPLDSNNSKIWKTDDENDTGGDKVKVLLVTAHRSGMICKYSFPIIPRYINNLF